MLSASAKLRGKRSLAADGKFMTGRGTIEDEEVLFVPLDIMTIPNAVDVLERHAPIRERE